MTHSLLLSRNHANQTLLTLIEVNRENLSESLPVVLKKEYGCHRRDMTKTELCLSTQLETSGPAAEIINELKDLEPKSCCSKFRIWTILFLTSLVPNIGLCVFDILSDTYLSIEYYGNMNNLTYVENQNTSCYEGTLSNKITLKTYADCLNAKSQFYYTIGFLLLQLIFYLTEFLTLRNEYEPTGLRQRIVVRKSNLTNFV